MKKGWKILLTAILLCFGLSMSACSSKVSDEGFELYKEAYNNLGNLKSSDIKMKLSVENKEPALLAKISGDVSYTAHDKLMLTSSIDASVNGVQMNDIFEFYVKDDRFYMYDINGEKASYDLKPLLELIDENKSEKTAGTGNKEQFKELSLEEEHGRYLIHAVFSDQVIDSVLKEQASQQQELLKKSNVDISIHSYTMDMRISKEKQIESVSVHMKMLGKVEDQKMELDLTLSADIKNHNEVQQLEFPDLKEYQKKDTQSSAFFKQIEDSLENTI